MNFKWYHNKCVMYCICAGLILPLFMVAYKYNEKPRFLVVDVQGILRSYLELNTKKALTQQESNEMTDKFARKLSETINLFAARNVVIVSKNAVLAGGQDITSKIEEKLFITERDGI